ncbi:PREDICTED: uncharacterized protein KIAA0930 homolog [Priapulus caudatus]|uniref:Uncharacterized protein KIAA0930 homolog n=1 Tax=Priapulus caudatus TaxID=37621 RepID=A0ABM1F0G7_PRICU|nr:PREDICTED: uncharacterized protein KIAA0930 homolog [Priapulus caudatus]XP_014677937.1 PREDICTED: uncharacterized protein KIAA0930 homolog [Priapulus caudatus]XP_014677938.1 PREDICTED: uncharacterized protein KIAA0930 homolog [Priapulus caudatus]
MVNHNTFWTQLFYHHFVDSHVPDEDLRDDMLFFVKKTITSLRDPTQTEIAVFRKHSKQLPALGEADIDWEETVYLNLILQQFEYTLTCAVCTRTSAKDLQILKRFSQRVYASPSKRQMDGKGEEEQISYPNIFFTVDNFDEIFTDIIVRDGEMVCVELVAADKCGAFQGVIFLGSIRYDALKKVYDARTSVSSRMAKRLSLGWYRGQQKRVEFVRMKGPQGKGHAEMAVSKEKSSVTVSAPTTPDEEYWAEEFNLENEESDYDKRRMSDPSANLKAYVQGFRRHGSLKKVLSASQDNLDFDLNADGWHEVEAGDLLDEFKADSIYNRVWEKGLSQAWYWLKERRRASCVALNAFTTYVTLPWQAIIADVLETRQQPVLTF